MTRRTSLLALTVLAGIAAGSVARSGTTLLPNPHLMATRDVTPVPVNPGAQLYYQGGVDGIGVETSPKVYVVYWGWLGVDPYGEQPYLESFLRGVGGSPWLNSTTNYCQGVPKGTVDCRTNPDAEYAGNPAGILAGVWADDLTVPPVLPEIPDFEAEALRAAQHFSNTSPDANRSVQYVIATPPGPFHNQLQDGYLSGWCAWHYSFQDPTAGHIAYTNLPYMPDAGDVCGQNYVNEGVAGLLDGVSIVEGHELAETITDQFPEGGWLDQAGAENGDKCAWLTRGTGASRNITLSTGRFAVQSLWSNWFDNGKGGCTTAS